MNGFLRLHSHKPSQGAAQNVAWGIKNALLLTAFALAPAAIAFVMSWASRGAMPEAPANSSWGQLAATYGSMPLLGGVIAGLMRPKLRTRLGATVVGVLIGVPWFVALLWSVGDPSDALATRAVAAVLGALAGGSLGAYGHYVFSRSRRLSNGQL